MTSRFCLHGALRARTVFTPAAWPSLGPAPRQSNVRSEWSGRAPGASLPEHGLSLPSLQASSRTAKVAPAKRMSKFLKHFTVVGDDYHAWNINYKKWENEEDDEEEEQTPPAPASGEEGRAPNPMADPVPVPRPPLDFRATLRKLFSSHRFQVGGQRPRMPGVGQRRHQESRGRGGGLSLPTPCLFDVCLLILTLCQVPCTALGTTYAVRDKIRQSEVSARSVT